MPFNRPTLSELISRTKTDIETRLPGADAQLRRSVLNVLARAHSASVHGLYGNQAWLAKQIIPDTAESEALERWAAIWGIYRKAASASKGNVIVTGANGTVIPAGTELQRADGALFTTDADGTIVSGTVTVAVTAVDAGADANTAASTTLSLTTPLDGIDNNVTTDGTGLVAGTDEETDDALRDRLLARIQQPPHGGADFDYIAWALEVSGVTRSWVFAQELGIGTVTVRFMMDDAYSDGIPLAADVTTVQAYIDALRPVTADLTVLAPTAVILNFTISGLTPSTQAVRDAIEAELKDLVQREATPGGTILVSHLREAISIAAGETDHVLTAPAADVVYSTGEIAVFGVVTWA